MTEDQVKALATRVMSKAFRTKGFKEVAVRSGKDHEGEPALFIEVILRHGSKPVGGSVSIEALHALSDELLKKGEQRFPYVIYLYGNTTRSAGAHGSRPESRHGR
jgi:hypothetical protein